MRDLLPELEELCVRVELRCDTYRPPNFQMLPTYADLRRRREVACTLGIAFGIGIMLSVIAVVLFIL